MIAQILGYLLDRQSLDPISGCLSILCAIHQPQYKHQLVSLYFATDSRRTRRQLYPRLPVELIPNVLELPYSRIYHHYLGEHLADPFLQLPPNVLNRVQIEGVRQLRSSIYALSLDPRHNFSRSMNSSIVLLEDISGQAAQWVLGFLWVPWIRDPWVGSNFGPMGTQIKGGANQ